MTKTYTTTQGDCWDTIAYKLWGRENLFHHLMAANPAHRAVRIFPGGVTLTVPDITVPAMQWELPPWMQ